MNRREYNNWFDLKLICLLIFSVIGCQQERDFSLIDRVDSKSELQRNYTPKKIVVAQDARPLPKESLLPDDSFELFEVFPVPTEHQEPVSTQLLKRLPTTNPTASLKSIENPHPNLLTIPPRPATRIKLSISPISDSSASPSNSGNHSLEANGQFPADKFQPMSLSSYNSIKQRAASLNQHAISLAQRGAYFSARAEFIQALRLLTQTLDTQKQSQVHSRALAQGLLAFTEANDFALTGTQLEAQLDLRRIISSHKTPVLKNTNQDHLTTLIAMQYYFEYAKDQLIIAGADIPEAADALFGLAKLQPYLSSGNPDSSSLVGPRTIALYQSAVKIDPNNGLAANELGVILAKYGQHQQAKHVLTQAVKVRQTKETWSNLAKVHEFLGEFHLAQLARNESISLDQNQVNQPQDFIHWTSPEMFSSQNHSVANRSNTNTAARPTRHR